MPYVDLEKRREASRLSSKRHRERHPEKARKRCRDWYARNTGKVRDYDQEKKLKKYGITQADFEKMWDRQNGCCAICEFSFGPKIGDRKTSPRIDHCHETGEVRGLLCHTCNRALGLFHDDKTVLESAIRYLTK